MIRLRTLFPFAALIVAAAAAVAWRCSGLATSVRGGGSLRWLLRWVAPLLPVVLAVAVTVTVAPPWARFARVALTAQDSAPVVEATAWIERNVDRDAVIVVDVPEEVQVERMTAQRGLTVEEAESRIAAQATRPARRAVATYVVDNTCSLEDLRSRVSEVFADLTAH